MYNVEIVNESAVSEIAALAGQTVAEWIQARVTELDANCAAQVRNIRASEAASKLATYAELPQAEQAKVDKVFADYEASKPVEPKEEDTGEIIKP